MTVLYQGGAIVSNKFFNPHLAMGLRVADMEKKIRQISDVSQRPAMEDVLEALKWIDTECGTIERRIDEFQEKRAGLEKRKIQLLSNPLAHEVLIGSLTLDELDLSVRSYNSFRRAGYLAVSGICKMTEKELLEDRHITKRAVMEVKKELAKYGFALEGEDVESTAAENEEVNDVDDLQAELERKFDELFGPLDDDDD